METSTFDPSNPTAEAVQLSAFIEHLQELQQRMGGNDPYVLIKVGGNWLPVRGHIEPTGEHRNAVQVTYLEL